MIEPLRFHQEKAPSFVISRAAYCGLCQSQKMYRDDPNLAVIYCPECPRRFQCKRCDVEAHQDELSKKHIRRLLVIGPGVRKKVLKRGDARNFPMPLDNVEVRIMSRTYLGGKMIGHEKPMPLSFQTGLSGPSVHVQVLGCRGIPAADMGGTSDPVVVALFNSRTLGETRVRPRTLSPNWDNETFVVPVSENLAEPRDMAPAQKDMFKLELYDFDTWGGNDFLGHVEVKRRELLDLATKSKGQPIRLPFTSREYHGSCFFSYGVKERVQEQHWGTFVHKEEAEKAEENKTWDFVLRINKAESLDKLNAVGYSDPLCEVFFGDKLLGVTPHKDDTCNPKWDRDNEFRVPVQEFIDFEDKLIKERRKMDMQGDNINNADAIFRIELYDYNYWLPNRSLGTVHIPVHSIRSKGVVPGLPYGEETSPPVYRKPKKKKRRIPKRPPVVDRDGEGDDDTHKKDSDENDDDDSAQWASDDSRWATDNSEEEEEEEEDDDDDDEEEEEDEDSDDDDEGSTEKRSTVEDSAIGEGSTADDSAGGGPSTGTGGDKDGDDLALLEEGGMRRRSKPDVETSSQRSGGSDNSEAFFSGGPPRPAGLPPSKADAPPARPAGPPPTTTAAAAAAAAAAGATKKGGNGNNFDEIGEDDDDADSEDSFFDQEEQSFIMKYICCCFSRSLNLEKKVRDRTEWAPETDFAVERENSSAVEVENDERGVVIVRLIPSNRGNVVMGLDEGVRCMSVGETATLKVRFDHAYNSYLMGANLPPRSNIVFTVELRQINGTGFWGMPWRQSLRFYRMSKRTSKSIMMFTTFFCRKTLRLLGIAVPGDDDMSTDYGEEESLLEDFEDEFDEDELDSSEESESSEEDEEALRAEVDRQAKLAIKKYMVKGVKIEKQAHVGLNHLFSFKPMPLPLPRKKHKPHKSAEEKERIAKEKAEKKLIRRQMREAAIGSHDGSIESTVSGGSGGGAPLITTDNADNVPKRRRATVVRAKPPPVDSAIVDKTD